MDKNKVMKLLNYKNIEVIGSSKIDSIKYPSDVDLQDVSNVEGTYDDIYKFFLNIFNKAYENKNTFIIDFKCGFYKGKAIKWKYQDIKNGYKIKNDFKIPFNYALTHENSMIKIDLIAINKNNLFTEYSCNYYFNFIKYNFSNFSLNRNLIIDRLVYDYYQLMKVNNFYKAMKRLFSISKQRGNDRIVATLLNLFNSPLGKLYKEKSNLETVLNVLTNNFRSPDRSIIIYNLNNIKDNLPPEYYKNMATIMSLKTDKAMAKFIRQLIDKISDDINKETFDWIHEH